MIDADEHGITEEELESMDKFVTSYIENLDMEQVKTELVELLKLFPKEEK